MYRVTLAALGAAATLLAGGARAETIAGVHLPDLMRLDGTELALASCGVRDTLWIEHYIAALYVPREARAEPAIKDPNTSKILLVRIISAEQFPEQLPEKWREPLKSSLPADKFSQISAAYKKLQAGDVMLYSYSPQTGLTMKVNGETVITAGHGLIDSLLQAWKRGEDSGTLGKLLEGHGC
jgi:hypothetical protein